ncbi:MAG: hypothetical protein M1837_004149 [Sclerophora amabilis]|nr:MAG: hypothetical protein M1837_004149 [Sclerophora amabilis]
MVARQMQSGLENIFRRFGEAFEKPLPLPPDPNSRVTSPGDVLQLSKKLPSAVTGYDSSMNGHAVSPSTWSTAFSQDEENMRNSLETAVTAAIDLFQQVDKQQLSLLGSTTELTGPMVERLIERYVAEQLHDTVVFPRLCAIRRSEDYDLEAKIKHMENVDITQVGIPITGGRQGKQELIRRLAKGVEEFRRLGVSSCPQDMIDILLATEKTITMAGEPIHNSTTESSRNVSPNSEKQHSVLTVNADTLVSLLLVVVIRSQVRHLQARLSYMQRFVFIDDVETGEVGYALSTFEAVLSYLMKDSGGLRKVSRKNKSLWQAIRKGEVQTIRNILEPVEDAVGHTNTVQGTDDDELPHYSTTRCDLNDIAIAEEADGSANRSGLDHVFPFQTQDHPSPPSLEEPRKKRVSMDTRSMSSSSQYSFRSRTTTIDSKGSAIEGDVSIERLSRTQDASGESILMMAVENRQTEALEYLLGLRNFYSRDDILQDVNNEGTTLLSAAIQLNHAVIIEMMLNFVLNTRDDQAIRLYLSRQDIRGRTMAHYLFNAPQLISRIGHLIPWREKDKNGQTPLFALCRSYDHSDYRNMVESGLSAAAKSQGDEAPLRLDDHVDAKGNTLLHIVNDPQTATRIMFYCDSDVNATNDKRFTPLMVASKYGRLDMVRAFFGDPRVDLFAKELRGFTAVELAKDEEVRNRIDDLVLLSNTPSEEGRITSVVRSFFVEDATIRLVLKSASPASNSTITVTTCRRSLADFENLAKWLSVEHPASWIPSISNFRSPFQIPSKPSRAVLRDIQLRLDSFVKILLAHPTFSTHELLWEFFLVPDIQPEMMAERSQKKAETRLEKVKDEFEPIDDVREVELFIEHARDMIRGVAYASKSVVRRVNKIRTTSTDLSVAQKLSSDALSTVQFLPEKHINAFARYSATLVHPEVSPYALFHTDLQSISSAIDAMLGALHRPSTLITSMTQTSKAIERHLLSLRRSDRWPLGLLDDTRNRIRREAAEKVETSRQELATLGCELRYTQQTVAGELAACQDLHEKKARTALRSLASRMVVAERARLESMRRAIRGVVDIRNTHVE